MKSGQDEPVRSRGCGSSAGLLPQALHDNKVARSAGGPRHMAGAGTLEFTHGSISVANEAFISVSANGINELLTVWRWRRPMIGGGQAAFRTKTTEARRAGGRGRRRGASRPARVTADAIRLDGAKLERSLPASVRIRSTIARTPFDRWGVRCCSRPSARKEATASTARI